MLPADHGLIKYQALYELYDRPLRHVANAIHKVRGAFSAIDIGANVGDTAAAMNVCGIVPVLCVEGDEAYWGFLERNAAALGPHVVLEKSFVGVAPGHVRPDAFDRHRGTTSIVGALKSGATQGTPVLRLEQILERHPSFQDALLLKVDTDGFDFDILLAHTEYLATRKPIIFFEYLIESAEPDLAKSLECIVSLLNVGYTRFHVFDNFGNYMLSTGSAELFRDLNMYLLSNNAFRPAVFYLDVCASTPDHADVMRALTTELEDLVLARVRDSRT